MYQLKEPNKKEIDLFAQAAFEEILATSTSEMVADLKNQEELVLQEFLKPFNEVFESCKRLQQEKRKGPVSYVHIFFLKAALMTKTYEFMINAFDERSYEDKNVSYKCWVPDIFIQYYEKNLDIFYHQARSQMVGFRTGHFADVKFRYYDIYLGLILQFVFSHAKYITELSSFQTIEKVDKPVIIYGGYMDKGIQVYPLEGVQD